MNKNKSSHFAVIGSGIAGLNFALEAAQKGSVTIITKKKAINSSTNKAQGGIAAVLDKTDNFDQHTKDTLEAGCYHNNKKAVEYMVKHGPQAIRQLIEYGVKFAEHKGKIELTREGGHQKRRIAFVGDYTGREIEKQLLKNVKKHPNITLLEHSFALELLVKNKICHGVQIIQGNKIKNIYANNTIIATGGIGQLYKYTTNPQISTGDGFALAQKAGCEFKDMEFIQFHPTAFDHKQNPRFLISEAVRGEGAILKNAQNEAFMKRYHKLADLAPRDIVSRAIFAEQKKGRVYLDITHEKEEFLKTRFPQIFSKLLKHSYNMAKDQIPVTPVAHYACGGIKINFKGQTNVKNLFAFGEVAYTGVHGANRLASNSLLEALVFSSNITKTSKLISPRKWPKFKLNTYKKEDKRSTKFKQKIKQIMWEKVGIIRNTEDLKNAIKELEKIEKHLKQIPCTNQKLAETRNMAKTGLLISKAALKNKKSIGCHYTG